MWGVLSAFISALLATACCLPALLFLLFGLSFGFLSFLESLSAFRIPLTLLSLFILYLSYRVHRQKTLTCNLQKRRYFFVVYTVILGGILMILLFPELAGLFLEESE
jgi:mercuric ion transport protein